MRSLFSSIRLRLTVWYTLILLATLGVVNLGVYGFMSHRLDSMQRTSLDAGYSTVEDVVINSEGDLCDVYHLGQNRMILILPLESSNDNRISGKAAYITESWRQTGLPMEFDRREYGPYGDWTSPEDRIYRIKIGNIRKYDYVLAYAREITDSSKNLGDLAAILLSAFPFAAVVALLCGFFLAGRALSPVKAIIRKAGEINAERLSERLPVSNPNDEIGRLARVINDTLSRLESAFDQLRRFTADAAHELRTPLTSIRSVGEVALQKPGDKETYKEAISSMLEEADRLTSLVDELLVLARGEAGKNRAAPETLVLSDLVNEVTEELRVLAEEKKQHLTLSGADNLTVEADRSSLRLALTNVIHNAIKYTQMNGEIEVQLSKNDDGKAVIDIIDNGPGLSAADRRKVFERFYRVEKSRSREKGGTGLGLAIAQWAVHVNRGAIDFCEKQEPGSCCRIILPISEDK